jgi:hyaluronoglucosaminidase
VDIRGVIEGFYGPPWSHADRLDLLAFCGRHGLNTWVHAPKDDPYHRKRWTEPYPDEELERFAELVREADRHEVEFVFALAPGLSIRYSSDDDFAALVAKCEQLRSAGVRSFQLLWDDLDGQEDTQSAAAHADVSNRFRAAVAQPGPLVVCPTSYAGTGARTPYRETFGRLLDADIVVYWTGPEVVSIAITREELDATVAAFQGRTLLIWDNYPANDFEPGRLFLGPLRGRDPRLVDGELAGLVSNPMGQAVPSKLALATMAEWARTPLAYDPVAAYERALRAHGAEVVQALRALASPPARVKAPTDVAALVETLALGVDAATGLALLEPFV